MRKLTESEMKKLANMLMSTVGDVVRSGAAVNVAHRLQALGLQKTDLSQEQLKTAHESEMSNILGRLVEASANCMLEILGATTKRPLKKAARKKANAKR